MARTCKVMVRDSTNPEVANTPVKPPAAGKDDKSNPPDQDESLALNNINALIRRDMIAMYVCVLGFKEGAVTALYDDQQITNLVDPLCELDNPTIKELCRQIAKEGHPVSMILQNCLKLPVIWAKHMWRTSCGVDDLSTVNYDQDIKHLQAQKTFEDSLDDSKEPDAPKMTLTPATVAASFTQMKTHLAKCRGTTGLPLKYVVRPQLKGIQDTPEDGREDLPPFGDPDSPYATIGAELTDCTPIL